MSAQIILFPASRIRRLTCSGRVSVDMELLGAVGKLQRVGHNCSVKLLYALFGR